MSGSEVTLTAIDPEDPIYEEALTLRYKIFFEPFNLPRSVTADDLEPSSTHVALIKNQLIGYGRVSKLEHSVFRLSQLVVEPSQRRHGYGKLIFEALIETAQTQGATELRLNSQIDRIDLYKSFGFETVGQPYLVELTGVEHIKMTKILS